MEDFLLFSLIFTAAAAIIMISKTVGFAKKAHPYDNEPTNSYGVRISEAVDKYGRRTPAGHDRKFKFSPVLIIVGIITVVLGIVFCVYEWDCCEELLMLGINTITVGLMAALFPLYMYPAKVARRYEHNQTAVIAWLNLFFGFTLLGWVLLLVWANSASKSATAPATVTQVVNTSDADELKKFKDLLDSGVISQDEFESKKQQLLGL
jgi:vacuolar-type H+-ATPase subunit I/STV1